MSERKLDYAAARELRARGWRIQAIADHFGCSYTTACHGVKGVKSPIDHRSENGRKSLGKVLERQAARSCALKAEIKRLYLEGLTQRDIAIRLSIADCTVSKAVRPIKRPKEPIKPRVYKTRRKERLVPLWVPDWFNEDYRRLSRLYGEEAAASKARAAKREASRACL